MRRRVHSYQSPDQVENKSDIIYENNMNVNWHFQWKFWSPRQDVIGGPIRLGWYAHVTWLSDEDHLESCDCLPTFWTF